MTKSIKVPDKIINYMEALQYNLERTKEIMAFMLSHDYDTHTKAFQTWDRDNQKDYVKYQEAKAELEREYVSSQPEWKGRKTKWSLNFKTAVLTVEAADAEKN